jgi:hypothetical protein
MTRSNIFMQRSPIQMTLVTLQNCLSSGMHLTRRVTVASSACGDVRGQVDARPKALRRNKDDLFDFARRLMLQTLCPEAVIG